MPSDTFAAGIEAAKTYNPVDVKQERAAFDTWWRMWCPDRDKPGPHVFDAWLARARSLTPTASEATAIGAGEVSVDDALAFADQISERHRVRANSAEAAIKAALDTLPEDGESPQAYHFRLRETLWQAAAIAAASPKVASDTAPGVREADLREAIRKAKLAANTVYGIAWRNLEEISRFELMLAALAASPTASDTDTAIPGGWKLVPIEPTKAMTLAGWAHAGAISIPVQRVWSSMLAASPEGRLS